MYQDIQTAAGHAVIVIAEPDDTVSIVVGRCGVYVLASLTPDEARGVRAMLLEGIRDLAATRVKKKMQP